LKELAAGLNLLELSTLGLGRLLDGAPSVDELLASLVVDHLDLRLAAEELVEVLDGHLLATELLGDLLLLVEALGLERLDVVLENGERLVVNFVGRADGERGGQNKREREHLECHL